MRVEWNGKKLTKKRALFLCWKLWEWLAKTGNVFKEEWPEWKDDGLVSKCNNYCPCCEYSGEDGYGKVNCKKCPLLFLWSPHKEMIDYACQDNNNSPYKKWEQVGTSRTRKKYAKIISDYAKKKYEEMK